MEETLLKALTAYTTTLGSTFTFVKLFMIGQFFVTFTSATRFGKFSPLWNNFEGLLKNFEVF